MSTIITGACNSVFTKLQDLQCVRHCNKPGEEQYFEEPVLQTIQMFIGEMLCWVPIIASKMTSRAKKIVPTNELRPLIGEHGVSGAQKIKIRGFRTSFWLAIPSTCDLLGTTLMNAGLLYTPLSIYQMTRGSLILFVGFFSVFLLKRTINRIEWSSLFLVFFGVFLVGLSGWLDNSTKITTSTTKDTGNILLGMVLIISGIVFSALQFVAEEHILSKIQVAPLELVGWEGLYGWLVSFSVAFIGFLLVGTTSQGDRGQWDIVYAFKVVVTNNVILLSSILIMISISSFNFFGISLTEKMNATARSTIDTSRTLLVWLVSLCIGWESFKWLQLFAFGLMVFGTLVFNGALIVDDWKYLPSCLTTDKPTKDLIIQDDVEANINRY
ncbi:hypothetical protein FOA43_000781 [Brettanomyces nanus]|uniref:Integral membrane protein n=1 Tax=Eeniella nana TaxID=13502 RepID=A0A875RNC7_EENNA|nr:uncharacterized protein FOA43_000781 [Brettanomyces nanus]QPG73470.1 hypothetical protein FOA43_000781 [Brettanomyces nanus]